MEQAHKQILEPEGKWKPGDWFTQPSGVQNIGGFLYPSWYNSKSNGGKTQQMTFDTVSKKKATDCTPASTQTTLTVTTTTDPVSKKQILSAPDGYDPYNSDDVHTCNASDQPTMAISIGNQASKNQPLNGTATVTPGKGTPGNISVTVDNGGTITGSQNGQIYNFTFKAAQPGTYTITATVTDDEGYTATDTKTVTISGS